MIRASPSTRVTRWSAPGRCPSNSAAGSTTCSCGVGYMDRAWTSPNAPGCSISRSTASGPAIISAYWPGSPCRTINPAAGSNPGARHFAATGPTRCIAANLPTWRDRPGLSHAQPTATLSLAGAVLTGIGDVLILGRASSGQRLRPSRRYRAAAHRRRQPVAVHVEWGRPAAAPDPPRNDQRPGRDRSAGVAEPARDQSGPSPGSDIAGSPRVRLRRSPCRGCSPIWLRPGDLGVPEGLGD